MAGARLQAILGLSSWRTDKVVSKQPAKTKRTNRSESYYGAKKASTSASPQGRENVDLIMKAQLRRLRSLEAENKKLARKVSGTIAKSAKVSQLKEENLVLKDRCSQQRSQLRRAQSGKATGGRRREHATQSTGGTLRRANAQRSRQTGGRVGEMETRRAIRRRRAVAHTASAIVSASEVIPQVASTGSSFVLATESTQLVCDFSSPWFMVLHGIVELCRTKHEGAFVVAMAVVAFHVANTSGVEPSMLDARRLVVGPFFLRYKPSHHDDVLVDYLIDLWNGPTYSLLRELVRVNPSVVTFFLSFPVQHSLRSEFVRNMAVGSEVALTIATGGWYFVGSAILTAVQNAVSDVRFASSVLELSNTGLVTSRTSALTSADVLANLFDRVVPSVSGWSGLVPAVGILPTPSVNVPVTMLGFPREGMDSHLIGSLTMSVETRHPRTVTGRVVTGLVGGVGGVVAGAVGGAIVLGAGAAGGAAAVLSVPVAMVGAGVANSYVWLTNKASPIDTGLSERLVIAERKNFMYTLLKCNVCRCSFRARPGAFYLRDIQQHYEDTSSLQVWRAHQFLVATLRQHLAFAGTYDGVDVFGYSLGGNRAL